jgi:hypothetical protein
MRARTAAHPRRIHLLGWVVGLLTALCLLVGALLAPLEVRHSAPFGFWLTLDADRGIAVPGRTIVANYPNFDRVDLDIRAYAERERYDLTLYIRPAEPGAGPIRTVPLGLPGSQVDHRKGPFANPFTTVRFDPIADSAGKRYYVWLERGPAHQDDVVTLWSIKTYSSTDGRAVLGAFLAEAPGDGPRTLGRVGLGGLMLLFVLVTGWLVARVTVFAVAVRDQRSPGEIAVGH